MAIEAARSTLEITGGALPLALPPAPHGQGETRLLATVCAVDAREPFGVWEFRLGRSATAGHLVLSPRHLDQGFLVLDHAQSPPLGYVHRLESPPSGMRQFDLNLVRSGQFGDTTRRYQVGWADSKERERCLLDWREQSLPPIDWFYVELTSHCNLSCPFCPSRMLRRPRASMRVNDAQTIFAKIGDYISRRDAASGYSRVDRMVFLHIMGEPILHPHFVACVELARAAGLVPALFTNATLLNPKNRAKIFAAGLTHVTISLNVVDQSGYSATGAKDQIADQERRVAALLRERRERGAHGLHIDVQYIVSSGHPVVGEGLIMSPQDVWEKQRKWLLLLRELDRPARRSPDRRPFVDLGTLLNPLPGNGNETSLRLPLDNGVDLVMKAGCSFGNATIPEGTRVVRTSKGQCPFGNPWRQLVVYADGSASFCNLDYENTVDLGNLLDQSIEEIWGSSRMQRIRDEMATGHLAETLCQHCLGSIVPYPEALPLNR